MGDHLYASRYQSYSSDVITVAVVSDGLNAQIWSDRHRGELSGVQPAYQYETRFMLSEFHQGLYEGEGMLFDGKISSHSTVLFLSRRRTIRQIMDVRTTKMDNCEAIVCASWVAGIRHRRRDTNLGMEVLVYGHNSVQKIGSTQVDFCSDSSYLCVHKFSDFLASSSSCKSRIVLREFTVVSSFRIWRYSNYTAYHPRNSITYHLTATGGARRLTTWFCTVPVAIGPNHLLRRRIFIHWFRIGYRIPK